MLHFLFDFARIASNFANQAFWRKIAQFVWSWYLAEQNIPSFILYRYNSTDALAPSAPTALSVSAATSAQASAVGSQARISLYLSLYLCLSLALWGDSLSPKLCPLVSVRAVFRLLLNLLTDLPDLSHQMYSYLCVFFANMLSRMSIFIDNTGGVEW